MDLFGSDLGVSWVRLKIVYDRRDRQGGQKEKAQKYTWYSVICSLRSKVGYRIQRLVAFGTTCKVGGGWSAARAHKLPNAGIKILQGIT